MKPPAGWEGILDEGEKILWQGRPDGRLSLHPHNWPAFIFGLFFAGFALLWMILAAAAGGVMWMFGLIHFSVGIGVGLGPNIWSAWRRRHAWYTLTNRRAFIATDTPLAGRRLATYPITADTRLALSDKAPATLSFASRTRRGKNGSYEVPIGFERIYDAPEVYALMRNIQRGET